MKVRGLSTTYKLAYRLYGIMTKFLPQLRKDLTPAEYVLVLGLLNAVQAFLSSSPFPGEDDDPGTPA